MAFQEMYPQKPPANCLISHEMIYTGILGKEIPSSPNRSRTYDLPSTSSDALPLNYRRLDVTNCY